MDIGVGYGCYGSNQRERERDRERDVLFNGLVMM